MAEPTIIPPDTLLADAWRYHMKAVLAVQAARESARAAITPINTLAHAAHLEEYRSIYTTLLHVVEGLGAIAGDLEAIEVAADAAMYRRKGGDGDDAADAGHGG